MATVFQMVATNEAGGSESFVADGEWHAGISVDDPRTVCGIQCNGEDGYEPGPEKKGRVTCKVCRNILNQIQSIKGWK